MGLETEARPLAQSGARDGIDDQAGLSAEFGVGGAADEFERLKRIGGKLRGKRFVLLIANDLLIDYIRGFAVIPLRMEEAVGIGDHAARGESDRVAQSLPHGSSREIGEKILADVDVRR